MAAPVQLRDIESAARAAGLACRGGFHPRTDDAVPDIAAGVPALTAVLLGFTGAAHWPDFAASPEHGDGRPDPLDRWSRRLIDAIGASVGAITVYPMDGPPWLPFQRWAMRAEPVHPSPLGVLIHPEFGLWHAYRGALLFPVRLSLPEPPASVSPCSGCMTKPCLSSCPIGAVMPGRYDHVACRQHVASPAGRDCFAGGCFARRACPVGAGHRYGEQQTRFHMRQFALRI